MEKEDVVNIITGIALVVIAVTDYKVNKKVDAYEKALTKYVETSDQLSRSQEELNITFLGKVMDVYREDSLIKVLITRP